MPPGLSQEEWVKIGSQIAQLVSASMWLIGDWLAYGQNNYHGLDGFKRIENDRYSKLSKETGFAEITLRNAKWVCSAVNLSRRQDKLTFSHALEIVGRVAPGQIDYWIDRVVREDMPRQKLREELKMAKAVHSAEPNDHGASSSLAISDQWVRDIMALSGGFTPDLAREHLKVIHPAIEALKQIAVSH